MKCYAVIDTNVRAHLVTGNTKHFPKQPFVVTPRELIDLLDAQK